MMEMETLLLDERRSSGCGFPIDIFPDAYEHRLRRRIALFRSWAGNTLLPSRLNSGIAAQTYRHMEYNSVYIFGIQWSCIIMKR